MNTKKTCECDSQTPISCDLRALDGSPAPTSGKTVDFHFGNLAAAHSMLWATLDERSGHTAAFVIPELPGTPRSAPPAALG
jgi:hypothetical protein